MRTPQQQQQQQGVEGGNTMLEAAIVLLRHRTSTGDAMRCGTVPACLPHLLHSSADLQQVMRQACPRHNDASRARREIQAMHQSIWHQYHSACTNTIWHPFSNDPCMHAWMVLYHSPVASQV